MLLKLDSYLATHSNAVNIRAERASILANNLANADTPGFKSRDVSFKDALTSATGKSDVSSIQAGMSKSHRGHITSQTPGGHTLLYRTPVQHSLDGNTVETDVEKTAFSENAVRYEASLQLLNGKITGLLKALKGE